MNLDRLQVHRKRGMSGDVGMSVAASMPRWYQSTPDRCVIVSRIVAAPVIAIVCICALRTGAAENGTRYRAVLADGKRITGPEVLDWGTATGTPKLGNRRLLGTQNPVRWLSDNSFKVPQLPAAFVEFMGGDRLPGTVLKACYGQRQLASVTVPDHLVVQPHVELKDSTNETLREVRVIGRMIRRIVWQRLPVDRYRPGTLFAHDGQQLTFRGCRFLPGAVRLLTQSGIKEMPFDNVAELHLPQTDPWEAYYDELAALNPDLSARMFQIETSKGLIATSSTMRFQVPAHSNAADSRTWCHLIQPAWSLDAFAVRHQEIHMRRYFAPHEVPLSRIHPVRVENRSALHRGRVWQVNRNVNGRPLQSGEDTCGWGFGIHGHSELKFTLPPTAAAFRTQLKLDSAVGDGGCVRAAVTLSAGHHSKDVNRYETIKRLYRSDLLVGSKTVLETGDLLLTATGENQPRLLTLAVDPVNFGHPEGADPLDIRDTFNWVEPLVLLDRKALAAEVYSRSIRAITAWNGWEPEDTDKVRLQLIGRWDARAGQGTNYRFAVRSGRTPLTLSRTMTVTPEQKWLIISAAVPGEEAEATSPCELQLRIDGEVVVEHKIPVRLSGAEEPRPLAVPLQSLAGRKVKLEIVQRLFDKNASNVAVDWRTIGFTDRMRMLHKVFEDRAEFTLLPSQGEPKGIAELLAEGAYAGTSCVRITPGGRFKIELGEMSVPIREHPRWGEFRYIRFAFRERGKGQVVLELEHDDDEQRKLRYFAGRGDSPVEGAKRAWTWATRSDLPNAWIVETRDLYGDFGGFHGNVTGVILSCTNCENVLFDHVYLGRTAEDFELAQVERIATPEAAAEAARAMMVKVTLEKALPASVLIKAEDRAWSGVIVSKDGLVLTVGHAVVEPKRDVTLVLADGREVKGQTLGVDRANDAAMVRITDQGEYPFVQIAPPVENLGNELLLGVAHQAEFEPGQRPMAHLTWMRGDINGLIWTGFSQPISGSGGPLLIATSGAPGEGKLIGIHSRYAWGGFLYTPIATYRENWDRLKKGEVWGTWGFAAGPLMGIYPAAGEGGCKINLVVPEGPAHRAGLLPGDLIKAIDGSKLGSNQDLAPALANKDPGQEVNIQIERAGKTLDVKVVLGRRK